jgi:hypothetical protein
VVQRDQVRGRRKGGSNENPWLTLDLANLADRYGPLLDEVIGVLVEHEVKAEHRYSVRDIVHEYLLNHTLHGTSPHGPGKLEIGTDDDYIYIRVSGEALRTQVQRMQRVLSNFHDKSSDELLAEHAARFQDLGDKPSDTPGAGLGLLLVAALSSKPPDLNIAPGEPLSWYELSARVFTGSC